MSVSSTPRARHTSRSHRPGAVTQTRAITLASLAGRRLDALCRAAGFGDESGQVVDTFHRLVSRWGDMPLDRESAWVSDISDDNTPVELSAAISEGRVQVRVLLEAQAAEPTLPAYREAALALTERLEQEFGADLTRFRKVQDIFLPETMSGPFALWHSVVFDRGHAPTFKAYFNPQAQGRARAPALIEEALQRLDMPSAWGAVCATARRGPHLDELKYFALDLAADETARVKVYVRHHDATAEDLEAACSLAEDFAPGEVDEFVRVMSGDEERLAQRATFTCSAFVGGSCRPRATTVYVPICAYSADDSVVQQRVHDYLVRHGMQPRAYDKLIEEYAHRPLAAGVGMQSWVAFRHLGTQRLTVYLATEAGQVYPRGAIPAATGDRNAFLSGEAVLRCAADYDLGQHPFIRRILREDLTSALEVLQRRMYESATSYVTSDGLEQMAARIASETGERQVIRALGKWLGPVVREAAPIGLARSVPRTAEAIASVRRGAMGMHSTLWATLDALYAETFIERLRRA